MSVYKSNVRTTIHLSEIEKVTAGFTESTGSTWFEIEAGVNQLTVFIRNLDEDDVDPKLAFDMTMKLLSDIKSELTREYKAIKDKK